MSKPQYERIVLKLSGEALAGEQGFGLSPDIIKSVAEQVKEVVDLGVEVAVVVGGGNIWRGKVGSEMGMDRATADYMGMLATVMNSLALQDSLEKAGVETRVQTSILKNREHKLRVPRLLLILFLATTHIDDYRFSFQDNAFRGGSAEPSSRTVSAAFLILITFYLVHYFFSEVVFTFFDSFTNSVTCE